MHISMGKVITISDEAYETLSKNKEPKESFSKVIMRKLGKKGGRSLMDLAGVWKDSPEVADAMKKVHAERSKWKLRDAAFDYVLPG